MGQRGPHHGHVGLAAGAREGGHHVALLLRLRVLYAQDLGRIHNGD